MPTPILATPTTTPTAGENSIVIVGGANLKLRSQDVLEAASLIAESKVVVCQLEVPLETTLQALRLAREHGGEGAGQGARW